MRKLLVVASIGAFGLLMSGVHASADPPAVCFGTDVNDGRATDVDDYLSGTDDADAIALGFGDDQYFAALGNDAVCGNAGNDVIAGEGGADRIDGGPGDDIILGMGGDDVLRGNIGADEVRGGAGDDRVRGGTVSESRDDLYDGVGNDEIIGTDEDVWHKCDDGMADDASDFTGIVVPDTEC